MTHEAEPFHVVIPARHASERLPAKALADIAGRPMIRHVWDRATESGAASVTVATDSETIRDVVRGFGGIARMTRPDHQSGTDRIAEVAEASGWPEGAIVVNLQGDEPMMPPALLARAAALLDAAGTEMSTLATPIAGAAEFRDPNVVKVVIGGDGDALYFSRAPIPWPRDSAGSVPGAALRHLGIYAYRCRALRTLVAAPATELERTERLEQLRALHLGFRIRVGVVDEPPPAGVDTADDLERVRRLLTVAGGAGRG